MTNKCIDLQFNSFLALLCGAVLCVDTYMEGSHKEGESQKVQVGIHKDSFNLISVLFCETCDADRRQAIMIQ